MMTHSRNYGRCGPWRVALRVAIRVALRVAIRVPLACQHAEPLHNH